MTLEVVMVLKPGAEASALPATPALTASPMPVFSPVFEQPSQLPPALRAFAAGDPAGAAYEAEMARYYRAPVEVSEAAAVLAAVQNLPEVEAAYLKPAVENPLAPGVRTQVQLAPAPLAQIPDLRKLQLYAGPAPAGVNAPAAWAKPGGRGSDIRVIDIEGGWCLSHLDLRTNSGGLASGVPYPGQEWRDHGTAVLGEISGDDNPFGVTGLAPDAMVSVVSHSPAGSAGAIQMAASRLRPGDVLLLEMHRPGPRFNYQARADQRGYIAVEWWPDDFLAIVGAVARGVIVVEAAGNGAENFDDAFYDAPGQGFPANWRNPFSPGVDSGAIIVGAGAPPNGQFGPDRSRLDFSNFGERVDCQAWGRSVVTTGYGDLFRAASEDGWYTGSFSGTSSASPIVTGAVACLQGVMKTKKKILSPLQIRQILRTTGSPQTASPSSPVTQRIGPRPDLAAMLQALGRKAAASSSLRLGL